MNVNYYLNPTEAESQTPSSKQEERDRDLWSVRDGGAGARGSVLEKMTFAQDHEREDQVSLVESSR